MEIEELRKGIDAYKHEQEILLRLIRKLGGLTESKFDALFNGREFRKKCKLSGSGISGDSFLLGMAENGFNIWAWNLDLLQKMMILGLVDTRRDSGNKIVYILPTSKNCEVGKRTILDIKCGYCQEVFHVIAGSGDSSKCPSCHAVLYP